MSKRKKISDNAVVQFRLGPILNARIDKLAREWRVTLNEAARRLVTLAVYGLTVNQYKAIEQLAFALGGGNEFIRACEQGLVALDSCDLTRRNRADMPLRGQQRLHFLEEWVQDFTSRSQVEAADAYDEQAEGSQEENRPRAIDVTPLPSEKDNEHSQDGGTR